MAILLAHEHFDLLGESQEPAVEVAGDPLRAAVGDTVRRLGDGVALVLPEEHDLGALNATRRGLGSGTRDEIERLAAHVTVRPRDGLPVG